MLNDLLSPLLYPFAATQRIFWLYLYSALVAAFIVYLSTNPARRDFRSLCAFLFPPNIYRHRSTFLDLKFFYVNTVVQATILVPVFAVVSLSIGVSLRSLLDDVNPSLVGSVDGGAPVTIGIFTLLVALALDFGIFLAHTLQHRIPWLWEFHKVHHTAEVLTPMTVYRMHPVDNLLTAFLTSITVGIVLGTYQHLASGQGVIITVLGSNIVVIVFYLMAYNLRHSHIWLSYGSFWSRVFISPAQHQIHHSSAQIHHNKNMGFIFAFWDGFFGSLYVPKSKEVLSLGIDTEDQKEFNSVLNLYFQPFRAIAAQINGLPHPKRGWIRNASLLGILLVLVYLHSVAENRVTGVPSVQSDNPVFLEYMTWQEVDDALAQGVETIIIPTGGTEQNGPHMALGKHNFIVEHTAGRIAERLGNTLVAPVVSYVPEGEVEPVTGHMRFSGTLSVSEKVFEGILESAASSFKAHGFRLICFLGDSGGNQLSQQRVAQRLNRRWSDSGVRVLHVSEYYAGNGQLQWLVNQGNSSAVIGTHAGIRDTSELLYVLPEAVRFDLLADNREQRYIDIGADGNSSAATQEIGNKLLELKIQSAVNQVRRYRESVSSLRISDR